MGSSRRRSVLVALTAAATLSAVAGPASATPGSAPADSPRAPHASDRGAVLRTAGTDAPAVTHEIDQTVRKGSPAAAARAHLAAHPSTYHVASSNLVAAGTTSRQGHQTVRFNQRYHGVPVFGAQYAVNLKGVKGGHEVDSVSGKIFTDLSVDTTPDVSEALARQRLSLDDTVRTVIDPDVSSQGLVVLPMGQGLAAWHFVVTGTTGGGQPVRQSVFVDANVGGIALSYNMIDSADGDPATGTGQRFTGDTVPLQITRTAEGYELRDQSRAMHAETGGEIQTYDAQRGDYQDFSGVLPPDTPLVKSDTNVFDGDATSTGAVDAHVNSGKVYEYLRTVLGRDGVDGKGGTMKSVVNVSSNGRDYANAFWDGSKMVYGHYNGVPFSVALDVVGHEMTHGVTEHSAGLVYLNQSGALNEAISDYFGDAMENDDLGVAQDDPNSGLIGEHLCPGTPEEECALRDLNDGRRADQDYLLLAVDYDNGGVHANSTIAGGALWQIRSELDPHTADRLVYLAQTSYLTPLSNFTDLRNSIELAAKRLGLGKAALQTIRQAFEDHGIYQGWEEFGYQDDATTLVKDTLSGYEGYANADDTAAVVDGNRWAASTMGAVEFFAGEPTYTLITGKLDKPGKYRTIKNHGNWDVNPAMREGRLLWTRVSMSGVDVVEQQGNSLAKVKVVAGGLGDQIRPDIDGNTVVWLDTQGTETDVYAKVGKQQAVNLTPEDGTAAAEVKVHDRVVYWLDGSRLNSYDLHTTTHQQVTVPGTLFGGADSLQVSDAGVFVRVTSFFGDSIYHSALGTLTMKKLNLGRSIYAAQFAVNDDYLAFDSTTAWGALGQPETNEEMHKLYVAPVADVIAGNAVWERVACASGAQISPAFGDGKRMVWLDTSHARTDLVTRNDFAGSCS